MKDRPGVLEEIKMLFQRDQLMSRYLPIYGKERVSEYLRKTYDLWYYGDKSMPMVETRISFTDCWRQVVKEVEEPQERLQAERREQKRRQEEARRQSAEERRQREEGRLRQDRIRQEAERRERERQEQRRAEYERQERERQHQQQKPPPPPPPHNGREEVSQIVLDAVYKAVSKRCHPDTGTIGPKETRTVLMQRVNDAYQAKDLDRLQRIALEIEGK